MEQQTNQAIDGPEFFKAQVKKRSDKLMNYFITGYFIVGLILAPFYDTWLFAFGAGGILLIAFYSVKWLMPESNFYQYVLSASFAIFMAQFIYQMHGLFEMHFFVFIGSALLITYQNWKLQLPMLAIVILHHAAFSFIQNEGYSGIYFTQLDHFALQTFIIHILLTSVIVLISGLWAYQLNKYDEIHIKQTFKMAELHQEAALSIERKHNAEVLAALNKNLEQQASELLVSNAELEQFAYTASHDLQEPLRMVSYALGLLNKKYVDTFDEKAKQYINLAIDGSKRMHQLIADLLEFSRVGKRDDMLEEVDLNDVLSEIMASFSNIIEERHAELTVAKLPVLQTFKIPLMQALPNLLGNALKYQSPGAGPVISIGCEHTDNHWLFFVKDNGIGISSEYFESIFIVFRRLHGNGEYSGSGVGLAITKKVVENFGGSIWVESQEGRGSTFYFTVPTKETGA